MKTEFQGNLCRTCWKTHEKCRDTNCAKAHISAYVCRIFGIPPSRVTRKKG